jgi:methionine-rich copper-binding protein CopC
MSMPAQKISRLLWHRLALLGLPAAMLAPSVALSRPAQLHDSYPGAEAIIRGRNADYVIRFDGPVDHLASRMQITQSGRVVRVLRPLADSAVDVLFASGVVPPPGHYALQWEAVSGTGEVSRGEIPFTVIP